jgi:hypothetical protein
MSGHEESPFTCREIELTLFVEARSFWGITSVSVSVSMKTHPTGGAINHQVEN